MNKLSKTLFSVALLSGLMGLTACQSTTMNKGHMANDMHHSQIKHDSNKAAYLSEGQILKVLSVANKGEIMQAKVALPNLQTAHVKSFADSMINKHMANEQKGMALGNRLGLTPRVSHTSNALQTDSNNIVTKLSKTAAPADKTYIMSQIMVHDKVLKTIDNELLPNAKTAELRKFLMETRTAVAMHLEKAKAINNLMP